MIDLEKAENEFIEYTKKFDLENKRLKGKQEHSLRVRDISKKIAENLQLDNKEIQLATLIGLLHDIARFEQYTQYGTFRDRESVDHGDLGVEILKKNDYIKKYIENEEDIHILYLAIKNHKLKINDKGGVPQSCKSTPPLSFSFILIRAKISLLSAVWRNILRDTRPKQS